VPDELLVPIASDVDVVTARQQGRSVAANAGFSSGDQTVIAAAISELARNILMYARRGEIAINVISNGDVSWAAPTPARHPPPSPRCDAFLGRARRTSPRGTAGIPGVERALQDGYSTSGGLGLGLPGARRLMDEFDVSSVVGKGTTVTMKKWRHLSS